MQKLAEHLLHVLVLVGRGLAAFDRAIGELTRDILSSTPRNLAKSILRFEVKFVADKHYLNVLVCTRTQRIYPFSRCFKRLWLGDVVDDESADSVAVVRLGDRPVFLLSRGVPKLRFDLLPVSKCDYFGSVVDTDRRG